jgi:hypothetical protein
LLYDENHNKDNKYVEFITNNSVKQLRIKQELLHELKNKKFLNIKFKGFYYKDFDENNNPIIQSLSQKDLYLRLYNPFKCTNEMWKHG